MLDVGQRIIDVAKGVLNNQFVACERLLASRFGLLNRRLEAAPGVERAGDVTGKGPGPRRAAEKTSKRRAGEAEQPGEADAREELRARNTDLRIGSNQLLLGLKNIRPADQQIGRKSSRHGWRIQRLQGRRACN